MWFKCAVPYKPEGFTNLVNSLRWAAMVPKVGSDAESGVTVEATGQNRTSNSYDGSALRRLLREEHEQSNTLTPLLAPEDAYRTVICISVIFAAMTSAHAGAFD